MQTASDTTFSVYLLDNNAVSINYGGGDFGREKGTSVAFEDKENARKWLLDKVSETFDRVTLKANA